MTWCRSILCGRSTSSHSTPFRCNRSCVRSHRSRPPRGRGDWTTVSFRRASLPPHTSNRFRRRCSNKYMIWLGRHRSNNTQSFPPFLMAVCERFNSVGLKLLSPVTRCTGTKHGRQSDLVSLASPSLGRAHLLQRGFGQSFPPLQVRPNASEI